MTNTLRLRIVTPETTFQIDDVDMVTIPGVEGEMGILPQHIRLMTQMVPGQLTLHKDGRDQFMAVGGGLVEVSSHGVDILTDMAIPAEKIDEARAEEARRRAEARLKQRISAEEVASVNSALVRSLAQLRVKRRGSRR